MLPSFSMAYFIVMPTLLATIDKVVYCPPVIRDRIRVSDFQIMVMVSYQGGEFSCAVCFVHGVSPFVFVPIQYRKRAKEPSENTPKPERKTHFFQEKSGDHSSDFILLNASYMALNETASNGTRTSFVPNRIPHVLL